MQAGCSTPTIPSEEVPILNDVNPSRDEHVEHDHVVNQAIDGFLHYRPLFTRTFTVFRDMTQWS